MKCRPPFAHLSVVALSMQCKVTLHTKPFLSGFGSMFHVLFTLGMSASFLTHYESPLFVWVNTSMCRSCTKDSLV